jgi:hypothetical protein
MSTFVLGIHWLPDMLFGTILGLFSVAMAVLYDRKLTGTEVKKTLQPVQAVQAVPQKTDHLTKIAFISYRREHGSQMARIIHSELAKRGYGCFLDVDDLGPQVFDTRLLSEIEAVPNFILVLGPGSLDRCENEDDWLRREISHSLSTERNIVPITFDGFQFPATASLSEEIREVVRHNAVNYSHEYYNATFDKLIQFLKPLGARPVG